MTDINISSEAGSEPVVNGSLEQPIDDNMRAFFESNFDLDDDEPAGAQTESGTDTQPASSETAPTQSTPGAANVELSTAGEPGADALTPGAESQSAPAIDPAVLAELLGLGEAPAADATPRTEPTSQESTPSEDEPFVPFQPNFKLPQQLVTNLFESESTQDRHDALVQLLSAYGNTIVQVIEDRQKNFYAPQVIERAQQVQQFTQTAQAVNMDFYSEFPELAPYKTLVKKAADIYMKRSPGTYTEETRNAIGLLAREAVTRSGITLPTRKGAAPAQVPVAKPPAAKAPSTPFEAGGARPGGAISSGDNGPGDLVDQLSQW